MQNGGCLDDGDGANGQNSCPDGEDFGGADFPYLSANVKWTTTTGTAPLFPPYEDPEGRRRQGRLHRHDARGHPAHRHARPASRACSSPTRSRPPTSWCRSCSAQGREVDRGAAARGRRRRRDATALQRLRRCRIRAGAGHRPAPDARRSTPWSPGTPTRPTTASCRTRRGKPRLLTSASSFGRMITKLHLLINPRTARRRPPGGVRQQHDRHQRRRQPPAAGHHRPDRDATRRSSRRSPTRSSATSRRLAPPNAHPHADADGRTRRWAT